MKAIPHSISRKSNISEISTHSEKPVAHFNIANFYENVNFCGIKILALT